MFISLMFYWLLQLHRDMNFLGKITLLQFIGPKTLENKHNSQPFLNNYLTWPNLIYLEVYVFLKSLWCDVVLILFSVFFHFLWCWLPLFRFSCNLLPSLAAAPFLASFHARTVTLSHPFCYTTFTLVLYHSLSNIYKDISDCPCF